MQTPKWDVSTEQGDEIGVAVQSFLRDRVELMSGAQSIKELDQNSVVVASNPTDANFLYVLLKSSSGEYHMYQFIPLPTWYLVRDST